MHDILLEDNMAMSQMALGLQMRDQKLFLPCGITASCKTITSALISFAKFLLAFFLILFLVKIYTFEELSWLPHSPNLPTFFLQMLANSRGATKGLAIGTLKTFLLASMPMCPRGSPCVLCSSALSLLTHPSFLNPSH